MWNILELSRWYKRTYWWWTTYIKGLLFWIDYNLIRWNSTLKSNLFLKYLRQRRFCHASTEYLTQTYGYAPFHPNFHGSELDVVNLYRFLSHVYRFSFKTKYLFNNYVYAIGNNWNIIFQMIVMYSENVKILWDCFLYFFLHVIFGFM